MNLSSARFNKINFAATAVVDCDMTGTAINDVNLSGAKIENSNLSGIEITDCSLSGLIIDGVPVKDLFEAHHELRVSQSTS